MTPATLKLHATLFRHLRGALAAYEEWIKANQPPVQVNPDPMKHFEEVSKEYQSRGK